MPKAKKPSGSAGKSTSSNQSGRGYSSAAAYDPRTGRKYGSRGSESASEQGRGPGVRGGQTSMSAQEQAARQGMASGTQDWAYARQLVGQMPSYTDPFNGMSVMDLLTAGSGAGVGSAGGGGGSGSGGGGGGSGSGVDEGMLRGSLDMQTQAIDDAYNARAEVLRQIMAEQAGIYDQQGQVLQQTNTNVMASLAARQAAAEQARQDQAARLAGIMGDLNGASSAAGAATAGVYGNAGSQIDQMASQYAALQAQQNAGANQTMAAFGGPANAGVEGGAVQALAAARGLNANMGAGAAASYAGRGAVYGGLQADSALQDRQLFGQVNRQVEDARAQQGTQYAAQQAQLAAQRSQGMSQYQMQLAEADAQRQQAAIQAAKERAQLALQYGVNLS